VSDAAVIRAWAAEAGLECPPRGRVPAIIVEAYEAAQLADLPETPPSEPVPPSGSEGETLITVTAWHEDWESPIAQAIADLVGVIEAATRDRVLTELRDYMGGAA
jgi:hypothetical protein